MPREVHEAYFREQLADIDEPTAPFAVLDVQGDGDRIEESRVLLSEELSQRIRHSARHEGVTAGILFHVAWGQVLAQCCGRDDVVFGTVLSGRLQGTEGADQVLGVFINTLPLRVSLAERSVREVLRETYRRLSELLRHEQAPLALAQRCSAVPLPLPLFSTLLNYRHSRSVAVPADEESFAWQGMRVLASEERTNYPITLSVDDLGQGFALTAQCIEGIDASRMAAYLHTAIAGLVESLSEEADRPIRSLSILPPAERERVLYGFNDTAVEYPRDKLIHQLFEEQVVKAPDAIALVYEGQSLSYGQLNGKANQLAHHLRELGVRPDARVAICMERGLEMVVGLLGILKAGGAYVPLDPSYPVQRLAYMLKDSEPVVLLTQRGLRGLLPESEVAVLELDLGQPSAQIAEQSERNLVATELGLSSRHLAYIIYTSGSTGLPKGVMVEHRNVLRLVINNSYAQITAADCVANCANPAFDASTWEIWSALLNGAKLLVVPRAILLDSTCFNRALIDGGATALCLTVGLFKGYVDVVDAALGRLQHLLIRGGCA